MSNTLHVEKAQTETTPGEFVTDGYRVTVICTDEDAPSEFNGKAIYQSRHANKAAMKAMVLTADERFAGFAVTFGEDVVEEAGKANLRALLEADAFRHIKSVASSIEPEVVETAVAMIKVMGGNSVHVADEDAPEDTDTDE